MAAKTKEELERERDEAKKQLEHILAQSRPKGLGQGVAGGVSNIVKGAVGAGGIAIIGPTMGLALGMRQGGIIGGALGAAGGAVAGAIGATFMAVAGITSGLTQIVQGIAATPESIVAPRMGKWWNEIERKWVLTNMEEEEKALAGIPDDDKDILGKEEANIDEKIRNSLTGSVTIKVVDMYYYDCLEIPADAEQGAIKRKYYLLAKQYHPDKNPGDTAAADKFKDIAEAYQVLSDPTLRAKYDQDGRSGLSADKTTVAQSMPKIDPTVLFAFLFGSDRFHDYIGRLSTATSAAVGDSAHISFEEARTVQKRRVTRMAVYLITKVTSWEEGKAGNAAIEEKWTKEAADLSTASYGHQLVTTIGKAWNLMSILYQGNLENGQGLPSLSNWAARQHARMEKNAGANKNQMETLRAGLDMMHLQSELQERLSKAETDEDRQQIHVDMEKRAAEIMIRVLWTTTVVDITNSIYEATQMIFFDKSVEAPVRKTRALALERLGEIWTECPEPTSDAETMDAMRLYEAAAFAAMLETVKQQDEAEHRQHS